LTMHGGRKLACKYIEAMYAALRTHRHASLRLQLFAAATGLFPKEALPYESQHVVLEVLSLAISFMEEDRVHTKVTTSRAFFEPWAHATKDLYVPFEFLRAALTKACASEPSDMQQQLQSAMESYATSHLLHSVEACAAASAPNTHAKRAHVLGRTGPFIQVDGFLMELAGQHRNACERRSERVSALVGSHQGSGSTFSLSQFSALVEKVRPGLPAETVEQLHSSCMVLGGGALDASDLEQALFRVGQQLQRTVAMSAPNTKPQYDLAAAEIELAAIAGKWHTMLTVEPADAEGTASPTQDAPFRIAADQPKPGRAAHQMPPPANDVLLGVQGNQQLPPQQLSVGKVQKQRRASMPAGGARWVG